MKEHVDIVLEYKFGIARPISDYESTCSTRTSDILAHVSAASRRFLLDMCYAVFKYTRYEINKHGLICGENKLSARVYIIPSRSPLKKPPFPSSSIN